MFRWRAEWEPQQCCLVGWPDHAREWGPHFDAARQAVTALVRALGADATVCVSSDELALVRSLVGPLPSIVRLKSGDLWLRDTGPVWRQSDDDDGKLEAIDFRWTGWGSRFLLEGDAEVAGHLAAMLDAKATRSTLAAEGGGLETNGAGTCITTRDCLLNNNRNPGLTQSDVEAELRERLGVTRIIWLDRGLRGDHTDGHVDNLARFVADGVVAVAFSEPDDPNHAIHGSVAKAVEGAGLELVRMPSPGARHDGTGQLVPASYLNFVIANEVVCVPTFSSPTDDIAAATLESLFPDRHVVGVDARALLYGGGALHCLTNNVPGQAQHTHFDPK